MEVLKLKIVKGKNIIVKDNMIESKSFGIMHTDETFHDLSRGYKFDEISMQKMAERAERNAERQRKKREEMENRNVWNYNPYTSAKDLLVILKRMFFDD